MEARGFVYNPLLTEALRSSVQYDFNTTQHGYHLLKLMVFINPVVAKLPQHRHLFGGHGCYSGGGSHSYYGATGGLPCTDADVLPKEFEALQDCRRRKPKKVSEDWSIESMPWECRDPNGLHLD